MEVYLKKSGLVDDLYNSIMIAKKYGIKINGIGVDLAAGNLWAIPHLNKLGDFEKLYCLEYSRHRLFKLGITVLNHYSVPCEKTILVYGNFYNLHLPDKPVDFLFLSQSFHHAENPDDLLKEMRRVLKKMDLLSSSVKNLLNLPIF